MNADERAVLETAIRRLHDAGDLDAAMTAAVGGYGRELFGFLVGLTGDPDRAGDVFGATCERMWKGLAAFRWDSSFRVWAYAIARNEFLRAAKKRWVRQKHEVPLTGPPSMIEAIDRVRTATAQHRRSDVKDALAKVREELPPDDHMLLGLRLDRKMAWNDIARVLGDGDAAHLARDAAALRKRFERLKEKLRELVRSG